MVVHMNDHKNKKMLGTILKDIGDSIAFKIKCERPEIQDVNVFNSICLFTQYKWKICKKCQYPNN